MESAALTGAEKPKENSNAHLYEDAQPSGGSDKLDSPSDKVESGSDQLSMANPEIRDLLNASQTDKAAPKPDVMDGDLMKLDMDGLYPDLVQQSTKPAKPDAIPTGTDSTASPSNTKEGTAGEKDHESYKGREEYIKQKQEKGLLPPQLDHGPPPKNGGPDGQLYRGFKLETPPDSDSDRDARPRGEKDRGISENPDGDANRDAVPRGEFESFVSPGPPGGEKDDFKNDGKGDRKKPGKDESDFDRQRGSGDERRTGEDSGGGGRISDVPQTEHDMATNLHDLAAVEQSNHTVKAEETIDGIAGSALGENASREQLDTYARAIRELNGIEPGQEPGEGTELKIPGVDGSDNFTYTDNEGTATKWDPRTGIKETLTADGERTVEGDFGKTVYSTDGTVSTELADGSKNETRPDGSWMKLSKDGVYESGTRYPLTSFISGTDGDGNKVETHTGDREIDNFTLKQEAEGNFELTEKDGDTAGFPEGESPERDKLLETVAERIEDPAERSRFIADMIRFENRAAEDGLAPEAVGDTYKEIGRLLDGDTEGKISPEQRVTVAEQVMSQAADPTMIDQGYHNTCNITTVESRMYSRDPAAAARFVTDAAMTGEATLADGRKVTIPESALTPDFESGGHPVPDGKRSLASQIFQVGAINAHYQATGEDRLYEQTTPPLSERRGDTGERLYDTSKNPPVELQQSPGLSDGDIADTYALLTGDGRNSVIHHEHRADAPRVDEVSSSEDLTAALTAAKEEGRMPITLVVHTRNEPFYTDSGAGTAGGSGGWHVVNITDFDPETGKAMVDNQWGTEDDHLDQGVDVDDLYMATMDPTSQEAELARAERTVDTEFPGLEGVDRNFKLMEHLSGGNLTTMLKSTMKDLSADYVTNGTSPDFDQEQHQERLEAIGNIYDGLPTKYQGNVLVDASFHEGSFPPEKFDSAFAEFAGDVGLTRETTQEFIDAFRAGDNDSQMRILDNMSNSQLNGIMMLVSMDPARQDRLISLIPETVQRRNQSASRTSQD